MPAINYSKVIDSLMLLTNKKLLLIKNKTLKLIIIKTTKPIH